MGIYVGGAELINTSSLAGRKSIHSQDRRSGEAAGAAGMRSGCKRLEQSGTTD